MLYKNLAIAWKSFVECSFTSVLFRNELFEVLFANFKNKLFKITSIYGRIAKLERVNTFPEIWWILKDNLLYIGVNKALRNAYTAHNIKYFGICNMRDSNIYFFMILVLKLPRNFNLLASIQYWFAENLFQVKNTFFALVF